MMFMLNIIFKIDNKTILQIILLKKRVYFFHDSPNTFGPN